VLETETPLILSIDTATRAGSVAITRGEIMLSEHSGEVAISHSAHLLQSISRALEDAGVTLADIDIFAAAAGPGSFTGLRIGLATVKSFAATLARSCVGVPTLYAVAGAAGESMRTLALLPAGRGEVFAQLLTVARSGQVHPLDAPVHLTPQHLLEKVRAEKRLKWAGEGAQIHAEAIHAQALINGILFCAEGQDNCLGGSNEPQWALVPSQEALAAEIARQALLRVRAGEIETPERLRAIYVRPSDAELNKQDS
jgi:tRNA threonylcarbamoyladenosine biosynthesis protein TsaB